MRLSDGTGAVAWQGCWIQFKIQGEPKRVGFVLPHHGFRLKFRCFALAWACSVSSTLTASSHCPVLE
jgi:hypothetical protein